MKRSIRRGVFETNSSSTHSLTLVAKEDFDKWKKGELLFAKYEEDFKTPEEVAKLEEYDRNDYETYSEYYDNICLETFESTFTTKSGDEVIAFGAYGYDG